MIHHCVRAAHTGEGKARTRGHRGAREPSAGQTHRTTLVSSAWMFPRAATLLRPASHGQLPKAARHDRCRSRAGNQLTAPPAELGQLTSLQILDLVPNPLAEPLPDLGTSRHPGRCSPPCAASPTPRRSTKPSCYWSATVRSARRLLLLCGGGRCDRRHRGLVMHGTDHQTRWCYKSVLG